MKPLEKEVLINRYLYYVLMKPIMSDWDYDRLEENAIDQLEVDEDSPILYPGSDLEESYPLEIIKEAENRLRN